MYVYIFELGSIREPMIHKEGADLIICFEFVSDRRGATSRLMRVLLYLHKNILRAEQKMTYLER